MVETETVASDPMTDSAQHWLSSILWKITLRRTLHTMRRVGYNWRPAKNGISCSTNWPWKMQVITRKLQWMKSSSNIHKIFVIHAHLCEVFTCSMDCIGCELMLRMTCMNLSTSLQYWSELALAIGYQYHCNYLHNTKSKAICLRLARFIIQTQPPTHHFC